MHHQEDLLHSVVFYSIVEQQLHLQDLSQLMVEEQVERGQERLLDLLDLLVLTPQQIQQEYVLLCL